MRIALISAVFPPEPEPSSVMAAELVAAWGRAGHHVTVISPVPNRPQGRVYPGFERRLWKSSTAFEGARCLRIRSWLIGEQRRATDRILENLTFGLGSAAALLVQSRPDVVVVETWPILAAATVIGQCVLRGIPVVNYIKDIFPEAATAAGLLSADSPVASALMRLDRWVCHRAAVNVVISERAAAYLVRSRRLPPAKVHAIPDWLDLTAIAPTDGGPAWRRQVGLDLGERVFMFAGTMGHASRVDILIEVANRLRRQRQIRLVCVGQGVLKPSMAREIERLGLTNLTLLPFQPRERVPDMQSAADAMLLTTSAEMGFSSVPNKLITYLAMGKPVICAAPPETDAAALVREHDLGVVVPPENPTMLAEAIEWMAGQDPARLAATGRRARSIALERYSLPSALARFDGVFADLGFAGTTCRPDGREYAPDVSRSRAR
jgi:colanic acid biosynthesis glycosyl transferase WcaI